MAFYAAVDNWDANEALVMGLIDGWKLIES